MRDYVPKKNNQYYIEDKYLYKQVLYMVLGYDDMLRRKKRIPCGKNHCLNNSPQGDTEMGLSMTDVQLKAVGQVIMELNAKYENTYTGEEFDAYEAFKDYGVYCWYRSRKNTDKAPCERTWKRYRSEFVYKVAKKLNYF